MNKPVNNKRTWAAQDKWAVIECLAIGLSQNRASQETGVPQRTISDWYKNPEFQQAVADKTVEFLRNRDNVHEQSVALAELLVHQGLTGDKPADSPSVDLAVRVLTATSWPLRRGEKHRQFGQLPPGDA